MNANPSAGTIRFEREGPDRLLIARQWLPVSPERLWRFVGDCRHMNHVLPGFMRFALLGCAAGEVPPALAAGVTYDYQLRLHGVPVRWQTLVTEVDFPHRFVDEQARGPYKKFAHEHRFTQSDGGTVCDDVIRYRPPGGVLAGWVDALYVRPSLRKLFEHRHARLAALYADDADPADMFEVSATSRRA